MSEFRAHLMEGIKRHLESDEFRYIDNSYLYYATLSKDAMDADKLWFAQNAVPKFREFIQYARAGINAHVTTKDYLYGLLSDSYSKELLVTVALYALLGHRFVKFPYYTHDSIAQRKQLHDKALCSNSDPDITQKLQNNEFGIDYPLNFYDGASLGMNAKFYSTDEFIYSVAYKNSYKYDRGGVVVDVTSGDYVMDCGACFGDTAIQFALKSGTQGKVFSFEPHPLISIMLNYNVRLNPHLKDTITTIKKATSNTAGEDILFGLHGAGSTQYQKHFSEETKKVVIKTTTIDHEIAENKLAKVDFIKMDIEGAELEALQGAEKSIRQFGPKLAICLYHKLEDFYNIPQFISRLQLGYKFHLEHHYVNDWETVLYAYR